MTIRNLDVLFEPARLIWLGGSAHTGHLAVLDKLRAGALPVEVIEDASGLASLAEAPGGLAIV